MKKIISANENDRMIELDFSEIAGEIRVSHRLLADRMDLRADSIQSTIERHIALFEQISQCPLIKDIVPNGFGARECYTYYLNEDQTYLLIGCVRSNDTTDKLKLGVVMAFKKARENGKSSTSPEQIATELFNFRVKNQINILSLLGYSQGYQRKQSLEIGVKIEADTGISVIPSILLSDPTATNPDVNLSQYSGTHAALVPIGSDGSTVTAIAKMHGISATPLNKILVALGYQKKIAAGKYVPTEKGNLLSNKYTLSSGKHVGTSIIRDWLYNTNKSFRDDLSTAINAYIDEQERKIIKITASKAA